MEAPTVSIKIKGLQAIEAFTKKGQLLSGLKGSTTSLKLGEIEAKKVLVTKNGLVLKEIEGHAVLDAPKAAAKAAAKGVGKGAVVVKGAKAAVVPGTAMSAKGLGWSLGLGGFGPWLALGALGLAATGLYFYLRAQTMDRIPPQASQLEDIDAPT